DLFDAERPFYQVTQMDDNPQVHPPARLAEERAQGNNATLFDHNFRSTEPVNRFETPGAGNY
ncbi:MAG TPA: type I-E CRISPR-associated protein Cse1/CasA, partial [Chloroflexota bacterium]|nr:type I-E CRISPR-associated protein Cse1/CasA [Chloroflexota bacterium]